jgi:transcriptional regulator with XRE-family HTH domain
MANTLTINHIISRNLLAFRQASGYTQQQIAEKLNISINQWRKYERGKNSLPVDKLFLLGALFGCKYSDILDDHTGETT